MMDGIWALVGLVAILVVMIILDYFTWIKN